MIAGVFQNRLDPKLFPNGHLGSDPTVFYVNDTLQLAEARIADWKTWSFWSALKATSCPADLPDDLAGYNTYTHTGLIPGPIATPTHRLDRRRARTRTLKDHYLYFLAKNDGSGDIVYAKNLKDHEANMKKYPPKKS